jgi:aspartate/methionine/tyrosine aminotransferase
LLNRGILVIADETYMHFVYAQSRHMSLASLPEWRRGILVVGSFSKSFAMTGWRAGYLIAPAAVAAEALKIQDTMLICAPVVTQKAVLAAITGDWNYPAQFIPELNQRRLYLQERLKGFPSIRWRPATGGFFAFVRIAGCEDSQRLAMDLLDRVHLVTIPGNLFGRAGRGFLRLSYGCADIPTLDKAFSRLTKFFSNT